MILALTGFMGSGKSATASVLAERLGWESIDLDAYIEHKAGRSIGEIFNESEEYFRALEIEAVTDIVSLHRLTGEKLILALGGGTFTLEPARVQLLEHCICVYLSAEEETIRKRIGATDSRRPLFDTNHLGGLLHKRTAFYRLAPVTVATDGLTPEQVADKITESLCLTP